MFSGYCHAGGRTGHRAGMTTVAKCAESCGKSKYKGFIFHRKAKECECSTLDSSTCAHGAANSGWTRYDFLKDKCAENICKCNKTVHRSHGRLKCTTKYKAHRGASCPTHGAESCYETTTTYTCNSPYVKLYEGNGPGGLINPFFAR